jgi:hypothetical protein
MRYLSDSELALLELPLGVELGLCRTVQGAISWHNSSIINISIYQKHPVEWCNDSYVICLIHVEFEPCDPQNFPQQTRNSGPNNPNAKES